MEAAAHGHSTLGIPKSVGQEFSNADRGKRFDAALSKLDAILTRADDLSGYGFNEADHPRDENGKFTTQNGAASHGIASYKKSIGWKNKGSGSGLMQHMIKAGTYSEKDILKAWNLHTGGTTQSAVKGQINLLKKAGYNPPPLPYESKVPSLKKMQEAASTPAVAPPAEKTLEETHPVVEETKAPEPAPSQASSQVAIWKSSVSNSSNEDFKSQLNTLFDNWDKVTPENKEKISKKLNQLANFAWGNETALKEQLDKLTPIAGHGMSISAFNQAVKTIQETHGGSTAKKLHVSTAPSSPRLTRMKTAFQGAKRFNSVTAAGTKETCPSLKTEFWNSVPAEQRQTAKEYTDNGYVAINDALRTWETKDIAPHTVERINHLDELFDHPDAIVKEDTILKRGETVPEEILGKWKTALEKGLPCRYMKDGFISASMASNAAFSGKNTIFEIVARKGSSALGVATVSSHKENEVLLRHGQNFEIFEIEKTMAGHVVRMVSI